MEAAIASLLDFIVDNAWTFLLLVVLISFKEYRLPGVILLYILVINHGSVPWWGYAILGVLSIFTSYLYPIGYYNNCVKTQIEELEKEYWRAYGVRNPRKVKRIDPEDPKHN